MVTTTMANVGKTLMGAAVGISVALFVIASLMPEALNQLYNTDTSAWDSGAASLWGVVGLLTIVVVVAIIAGRAMDAF